MPNPVLEITVLKLQEGQEIMTNNNCTGKYYLPKEVTFSLCFVCLFVCRIKQKLLDRFSQNSVGRGTWVTDETVRFLR